MFTIYVYVLDTLADWELGYVTSELNSGRFFKKGEQRVSLKMVSYSQETINTMGGMTIVPNCLIDDIVVSKTSMLLLPGSDSWDDPKHGAIIEKASEFLALGATVCAICGATAALANAPVLMKSRRFMVITPTCLVRAWSHREPLPAVSAADRTHGSRVPS